MNKFKKGDKVIVIKEYPSWNLIPYALKGWKGTIIRKFDGMSVSDCQEYVIKWDTGVNPKTSGNLIKDWMIELIERKRPKEFGIVEFCKKYY